jgi:mannose-6-phosphate isomerase-like protein (cupin superfamily)
MRRRSFLQLGAAAFPAVLLGQDNKDAAPSSGNASQVLAAGSKRAVKLAAGEDRTGTMHGIGLSTTAFKVSTAETAGSIFVLQHENHKKGGPPKHLHHVENEWFYVLEGEYRFEIGDDRFELKAGECLLAPREIPHVWAYVGNTTGRMIIAFAPAGQMEALFTAPDRKPGNYFQDSALYRKYGLELLGPPMKVE